MRSLTVPVSCSSLLLPTDPSGFCSAWPSLESFVDEASASGGGGGGAGCCWASGETLITVPAPCSGLFLPTDSSDFSRGWTSSKSFGAAMVGAGSGGGADCCKADADEIPTMTMVRRMKKKLRCHALYLTIQHLLSHRM